MKLKTIGMKDESEGLILASPEERVRLLRVGLKGKQIEGLYIRYNGFKIVTGPILFDPDKAAQKGENEHLPNLRKF